MKKQAYQEIKNINNLPLSFVGVALSKNATRHVITGFVYKFTFYKLVMSYSAEYEETLELHATYRMLYSEY